MHGFGGSMGFGMGYGWIFWLIIIGVAVWAVTRFTKSSNSANTHHQESSYSESPKDILKKRYARGEITKEEFDDMRKNL